MDGCAALSTPLRLSRAHYPVTALGPGRRIGLWLQGCSIGCHGCVSRDTWSADDGKLLPVSAVLGWCRYVLPAGTLPDGITISGGEPFEQPVGLRALLDALSAWREELNADFDLLAYSGLPWRRLQEDHADLLARLDALVPEPFVEKRPLGGVWRGSDNQPLLALSERGRRVYAEHVDRAAADDRRLQYGIDNGRVWIIGIPGRDDMKRIEQRCAERGLTFVAPSWR